MIEASTFDSSGKLGVSAWIGPPLGPLTSCRLVSFQPARVFSQKIAAVAGLPAFARRLAVEVLRHLGAA